MLPFALERGLLLEDKDILLAWGTPWKSLRDLGSPSFNESNGVMFFTWHYTRCLGGLGASVQVRLATRTRPLRELELVARAQAENPQQTFERVSTHLRQAFGLPTKSDTSGFNGHPVEEWHTPPVTIYHSIFERFGEYHVLRIQHRGKIEHKVT